MLSFKTHKFILVLMLLCLLCWPSQAIAGVWVFFRQDIPLHLDTITHLQEKSKQPLVFCPVGKTSFSFLESRPPQFVVVLGDSALELALKMPWKVKILVTLVDNPPADPRILLLDTQQPYAMKIRLLKTLVPKLDTIWYPYATERFAPDNAIKVAAEKEGLKISPQWLKDPRLLTKALRTLTQKNTAAILPPDPGIMNDAIIQSIFLASFRSLTPVVGFSEALTRFGAVFSYVLLPENLAISMAEIINEEINNPNFKNSKRVFDRWGLVLNLKIIEKFKLLISDQLKNSAFKLF